MQILLGNLSLTGGLYFGLQAAQDFLTGKAGATGLEWLGGFAFGLGGGAAVIAGLDALLV